MASSIQRGEIIELKIEDLAFGGKGVAKLDGMIVLVQPGLPGDRVLAQIGRRKRNYLAAKTLEIRERSSERVDPVCRHFSTCGGCNLQDLAYTAQLRLKTEQVRGSLIHLGDFADPVVHPALPSPQLFFYRNKMEFSFFPKEDGSTGLGLHRAGAFDKIFDLEKCWLQSEQSNQIVASVQDFVNQPRIRSELPPYHTTGRRKHFGFLRFLAIRESKTTGQVLVNLVTNAGPFEHQELFIQTLKEKFPQITGIVRNISTSRANIAVGETEELLWGNRWLTEKIDQFEFFISANSFFQTNTLQAQNLFRTTISFAGGTGKEKALDLYCGTGTIAILLSGFVQQITGVELMPEAVQMAQKNAHHNRVNNVSFYTGEVRGLLRELAKNERYNLVILDPPRAGLHEEVIKDLIKLAAPRLVYVSCNPATLARDLKLLASGSYRLIEAQPLDMFPHTPHIECVAKMEI